MLVRPVQLRDRSDWLRMRDRLWPGSLADHDAETRAYFEQPDPSKVTFLALRDGRALGFLELGQRSYAPGCKTSPVPFIEGWYVEAEVRRKGIGRKLFAAAESWAREAGYAEIASDVDIGNTESIAAHEALGYAEIERIVCFRKALS